MMQKIVSMNSSSIQMDEGVGFVQRRTYFCYSLACQYRWTKLLASSRDKPAIRYKVEKYGYIGVVFAKHPSIIKLEWDSIEVYCKRIQLENSFWGESCVYLCLWFVWVFIALVLFV